MRDELQETFVDLGEQSLKNIGRAMRVYALKPAGGPRLRRIRRNLRRPRGQDSRSLFGNPNIEAAQEAAVAAVKTEANRAANNVLPIIAEIRKSGATTLRAVAKALNARGIQTPRGGRWHAMSVRNALART